MNKLGKDRPVFGDPSGKRRFLTNIVIEGLALSLIVVIAVVIFGLTTQPTIKGPYVKLQAKPKAVVQTSFLKERPLEKAVSTTQNREIADDGRKLLRIAFVSTQRDTGSTVALKKHLRGLDVVIPDWVSLVPGLDGSGSLLEEQRRAANFRKLIRRYGKHTRVYPHLQNSLTSRKTLLLIADPAQRAKFIGQIEKYLIRTHADGIVFDREEFAAAGHVQTIRFLVELSTVLTKRGLKTLLRATTGSSSQQLRELAGAVDYVIATTEGSAEKRLKPGAPAGQTWFEERLRTFAATVPRSKLIVTIGSYALDSDGINASHLVSVQRAWDLLSRAKRKLQVDPRSLNAFFEYVDNRGRAHRVWMLDGVTAFNHAKAAFAVQPAGIAVWRLGLAAPGVWSSLARKRKPDAAALRDLEWPAPGYGSYFSIKGALLRATKGNLGKRSLIYNASLGLIVRQSITVVPRHARWTVWQPQKKKAVALTFDDGPDPRYTSQILDILKEKGAKATFYILGKQALEAPNLIRRMYDEGHDIGSHTFSHPNTLEVPWARLSIELNSTTRIVEAITGIRMHLFRPPYAGAGYGFLDFAPDVVLNSTKLGYMIAELGVDGCDYCFAPADQIVRNVVNGVVHAHRPVVLLHDAGGDRSATVAALPKIIDQLRTRGYRFVPTHVLVGLPRGSVMQPKPQNDVVADAESGVWRVATASFGWIANSLPIIAIAAAIAGILRLFLITILAIAQFRRRRRHAPPGPYNGRISVVVPAFNEEAVICKTVRSLLQATIADRLQVIVVDDGSTDRTADVVRSEFADDHRVLVLRKENGGKSSALNHAIERADAEVLVCVDGDTVLQADAIEKLTAHFTDHSVGAVAGNVVVGNEKNLITRFQSLEYITSQNLDRRAFEQFNAIGVVPGAIGAWRRKAVIEVGGYMSDTLAEDAELTIALQRCDWRVVSEPTAHALTEAPETLAAFMKQRYRWMFGMLQVAFKHSGALFERPRGVALITIPNVYIFQFGFTLLAPVMDLILLWTLLSSMVESVFGALPDGGSIALIASFWLLFQAIDLAAAAVALLLDRGRRNWWLLPLVVLQRFCYRQLLYVTAIRALLAALKGKIVGWQKLLRTGNVDAATPA